MLGKQLTQAAAGSAAGEGLYVDDLFSTYLWEGNNTNRTITNDIDLAGEGGLVWIKNRTGAYWNVWFDTERGGGQISSNQSDAELASSSNVAGYVSAYNSDGFSVSAGNSSSLSVNASGSNYASWTFRKAPGFFDVVTYTGDDAASRSVAHNLGSVPGMVVVKDLGTNSWYVYHRSQGEGEYGVLNSTAAFASSTVIWGNTAPTSTHFYVGSSGGGTAVNGNGRTYVAYVFAHDDQSFGAGEDESIIKCGTFTATTGTNINLGFEPQFVLLKSTTSAADWYTVDNMRGWGADQGSSDEFLSANTSAAEISSTNSLGLTQTGFTSFNGGGETYIYMAIRRPHKPPTAGTEVFTPQATRSATDGTPSELAYTSGFSTDLLWQIIRSGGTYNATVLDRVRGDDLFLYTNGSGSEVTSTVWRFDSNEGIWLDGTYSAASNLGGLMFKRAPGFFDIVNFDGTGVARTEDHGLGVTPEFYIVKARNSTRDWSCYHSALGATKSIRIDRNLGPLTGAAYWNDTDPTATQFSLGTSVHTNGSGYKYIAYLPT